MIARFRWLPDQRPRFRWIVQQGPTPALSRPDPLPALAAIVGPGGRDAYELAVQQGFDGTIEEWLESLKATGLPTVIRGGSF